MVRNAIDVEPFDRQSLTDAILKAAGRTFGAVPDQVDYLVRYCDALQTATVVRESHYIDRHYLDEYVAYYSRTFRPRKNRVQRFHFFTKDFDSKGFSDLVHRRAKASSAQAKRMEAQLSESYLGFASVRPISSAPIGRTVLRPYADGEPREIWATGPHAVHLANLHLTINGLAFQQQDEAVGACATTALWTALSRVARMESMRAPTPAEVTAGACINLGSGRAMPALSGLTMPQLCEASRASGFAPEVFRSDPAPEFFIVALHTYLLSGIPVVCSLRGEDEPGHAVTAVGFQCRDTPQPELESSIPVRSAYIDKLYVHDDRLGPFARAFLHASPILEGPDGQQYSAGVFLLLEKNREVSNEFEIWRVDEALAPLYPKVRLPVASLVSAAESHTDIMERVVGEADAPKLSVDFRYQRSGAYLAEVQAKPRERSHVEFLRTVALPRWCAISRWYLAGEPLVDLLFDTTDILRDSKAGAKELLRGVVVKSPKYVKTLATLGDYFDVPFT